MIINIRKYSLILFYLLFLCGAIFSQKSGSCPEFVVVDSSMKITKTKENTETTTFTAQIVGQAAAPEDIKYNWSVSKSEITKGQGTGQIEVKINGANVMAEVIVVGFPKECGELKSSALLFIHGVPTLMFEESVGKIGKKVLSAKFRVLFEKLEKIPDTTGYIVNYGKLSHIKEREELIKEFIKEREFDTQRIVLVRGNEEETIRSRLWIVPAGADPSIIN